ncbi:MAG TPA: flagellar hook-associated protein FlgK [Clostridia bacterium]|nr:flagellar hook-associated protein FlgK [Clostridia bacterium]
MRDSFFGLNVALRGLYTAQRNMDIVNHNLNNVNTPGYSRQQGVQAASQPLAIYDGTGMVGTGSDVVGISRVRDEYLDFKYWSESVSYGEWDIKSTQLSEVEATFNEPSNSGFNTIMNEFYSAMQELAKDPSSSATRALVQQKGVTVAKYFNSVANHFDKMQTDINYTINTKVSEVNSLATQIQQLNKQIYTAELDGNTANDLRDQRTALVDKMSKIVNIEANEVVAGKLPSGKDDKHLVITISGKAIIDHFNISKLEVKQRKTKMNAEDVDNLYEVGWEDGNKLEIKGGELKGYLDIRDGNDGAAVNSVYSGSASNSPMYKGIPFYMRKMNQFVRTFAKTFNEGVNEDTNGDGALEHSPGHAEGYRLDSTSASWPAGIRFFTMKDGLNNNLSTSEFLATNGATISDKYNNITAKNFAVSEDVLTDLNNISTSAQGGQKGNIDVLNSLITMRHDTHMFEEGAPEDFMKSLVATLGIDAQQAERLTSNQQTIVQQIDNRRTSTSGVSIDEEMANLVKYQQAYSAAARMITTMSEVYDTLINRVGNV